MAEKCGRNDHVNHSGVASSIKLDKEPNSERSEVWREKLVEIQEKRSIWPYKQREVRQSSF